MPILSFLPIFHRMPVLRVGRVPQLRFMYIVHFDRPQLPILRRRWLYSVQYTVLLRCRRVSAVRCWLSELHQPHPVFIMLAGVLP